MSLPLFPLPDLVPLPGLALPLYIFEQRYRDLLARVRNTGEPFGVTRLRPSADGRLPFASRSAPWGSYAHLREVVDHEDGSASILAVGGERFEIVSFDTSRSYLSAEVRTLPLPEGNPDALSDVSQRVLAGVAKLRASEAVQILDNAPGEPLFLATYCAALLPLSGEQREEVLMAPSLVGRFEVLARLMPNTPPN